MVQGALVWSLPTFTQCLPLPNPAGSRICSLQGQPSGIQTRVEKHEGRKRQGLRAKGPGEPPWKDIILMKAWKDVWLSRCGCQAQRGKLARDRESAAQTPSAAGQPQSKGRYSYLTRTQGWQTQMPTARCSQGVGTGGCLIAHGPTRVISTQQNFRFAMMPNYNQGQGLTDTFPVPGKVGKGKHR